MMKKELSLMVRFFGVVVILWLFGCGTATPEAPSAMAVPSNTPQTIVQPTAAPTPTESILKDIQAPIISTTRDPEPPVPPAVGGELDEESPWLMYYDPESQDLVAVNPDGSGRTRMNAPSPFVVGYFPVLHPSPDGGTLAYLAGSRALPNPDLEIVLLNLPEGEVEDRIALFGPDWHKQMDATDLPTVRDTYEGDVLKGVWSSDSIEWSPDGRYLAFSAALHGPSSDVYTYDTVSGMARRLTTGSNQSYDLNWSPDGAWIVHQEVVTFGNFIDWNVEALWAVDLMGEEAVKLLEDVPNTFIERWVGDRTFIIYEWDTELGPMYLKEVDFREEGATRFFNGPLRGHAFESSGARVALYLDDVGAEEYGIAPGIVIQPRYGGTPWPVFEGAEHIALSMEWSEPLERYFAGLPKYVIMFDRDGENLQVIDAGGVAKVSPDGEWLVIFAVDDRSHPVIALYTAEGNFVSLLYDKMVEALFWAPNSGGFFFVDDSNLYFVSVPEGKRWLVETGTPDWSSGYVWVREG